MSKKKQEKFDTFDSRMKKVREVTLKELRLLYINVQDAYSWFSIKNMATEAKQTEQLIAVMRKFEDGLMNKNISLDTINSTNSAIDEGVKVIHEAVVGREKILERTLAKGITARISETGYASLFDKDAMYDLERERTRQQCEQVKKDMDAANMERMQNQDKAVRAMFSGYTVAECNALRAALEGEAE